MKIPTRNGILWDNWFKRFSQKTKPNTKRYNRKRDKDYGTDER